MNFFAKLAPDLFTSPAFCFHRRALDAPAADHRIVALRGAPNRRGRFSVVRKIRQS
jgi:hypothetical protein